MRSLHKHGFAISAGVLNIGDSDWETAKELNIDIAEEAPFAPISKKQFIRNLEIMKDSNYIILEDIPFGHGNKANLVALLRIMAANKKIKVFIIKNHQGVPRDYTGGKGQQLYSEILKQGAILIDNYNKLFSLISTSN